MGSVFQIAQLVLGLLFYTLAGQALMAAFLGPHRFGNNIYMAMDKVVWAPKRLAGLLLPDFGSAPARRLLAVVVALVAWFAIFPKLAPVLAYWGYLRLEVVVLSWLLLALLLAGMALTVPPVWLRSFTRGLLAMGLVEYANRLLIFVAERAGWIQLAPPASAG